MSEWSHLYNDRRWRRLREGQLTKYPLCERCSEEGKVTVATVCDHVNAHKGDLVKFWSGPFASLCKYHHDVKTIMEDGGLNSGGAAHPVWLPRPACQTVLVTGPPCSGKTTYARERATKHDQVIDLDDCFTEICGTHGHMADRKYLGQAIRLRNKLLANLASKRQGIAYFIIGAPTQAECDWWVDKLGASHVRLNPGRDQCLARAVIRGDISTVKTAIDGWYRKAEKNQWAGPKEATTFDVNGIPSNPAHPWAA